MNEKLKAKEKMELEELTREELIDKWVETRQRLSESPITEPRWEKLAELEKIEKLIAIKESR